MDIFGTISGGIDLVGKLVGYLQAVKGAKEDRLKLLSEVSALGVLLEIMRGRLDNTNAGGGGDNISNMLVMAAIEPPLRDCHEALRSTVDGLERLVSNVPSTPGKPLFAAMRNLKWPFHQEDIRKTLGKIERLKTMISLALQTSLMGFIEKTYDELAIAGLNIEKIKSVVSSLEANQRAHTKEVESVHSDLVSLGDILRDVIIDRNEQTRERLNILQWLSAPEFEQKHSTAIEKRAAGTGEWFLGHSKFVAWRRGEHNALWCPGNPGVGKSVMTSLVIQKLKEGIADDMAVVFIYFEYTTNYTKQQLVKALLSQFVRRGMLSSGMDLLQRHMIGDHPTLEELWIILKAEVGKYARVFVVIDALDEADSQTWIPLLGRLREFSGVRILATSRDLGDIEAEFQGDCRLDIVANEGDLKKYVEERISHSVGSFARLLEADPSLHAEIVSRVAEKADGMFLLAQLHMNSLQSKTRLADLRQALTELPQNLKSAYDTTMARINTEDKPLVLRIFSWVIHAARPMTIDDLQYALAVEDGMSVISTDHLNDRAHLTSVCVGLVVLQDDTSQPGRYVGLAHPTIKEYLHDHLSTHLPHPAHLAITCLEYLLFDAFRVGWQRGGSSYEELMGVPLANYAIYSWGEHARIHCNDPTVRRLALELLNNHQRVVRLGSIVCHTDTPSAIQLCAHFGLKDYLTCLLNNGYDVNSKDSEGDTALTEAAIHGQGEILQLLLARGDINVNPEGWNGFTPLVQAVLHGHQRIVELLLARDDVDVNWRDHHGRTPIAHAAQNGYSGVVHMLLERGDVNIHSQDSEGRTPLALAILGEHEAVVQVLLARRDVGINVHDNQWRTPVTYAAAAGHRGIMRLLLKRLDVDINLGDRDGYTPLALAILWGHRAIIRLLLAQHGVDVNHCSNGGMTPIAYAVAHGRSDTVGLLLERKDVNVNSQDGDGRTPLTSAILEEDKTIIQLLLTRDDVDVNHHDNDGMTPIAHAARKGYSGGVALLLVRDDVNIHSLDKQGYTPLALAILGGHEAVVQRLLARDDLDISWKNASGETYLILAATRGNEGIVSLLLAAGRIDINSRESKGRVALSMTTSDAVAKALLAHDGIDINAVDLDGNTPLDWAENKFRRLDMDDWEDPGMKQNGDVVGLLRRAGARRGAELRSDLESREGSVKD